MPKKLFIVFLFVFITAFVACGRKADVDKVSQGHRMKYNFNYEWLFIKANPKYANKRDFNDSQWRKVSCPHTFNEDDTYDEFLMDTESQEGKHWHGTVWYRKHFSLPQSSNNKKVYIEFESVHQDVEVFLNGFLLGKNRTAFIPFGYDLSPFLKWNEDNVLAVKVSNDRGEYYKDSIGARGEPQLWQAPLGGITSNVNLYVMDPLHITLPLYDNMRTTGAYVYTKVLKKQQALIAAEVQIHNEYQTAKQVELETLVFDSAGALCAHTKGMKTIGSHEVRVFINQLTLEYPKLWSLENPYLYTVCHVLRENDVVLDSYSTPLGIRQFGYDKTTGLSVNDSLCVLKGWGQKTTSSWPGLGSALPDWLREYSFKMMDNTGANFIRWRRSSPTASEIKLADKYGFLCRLPSYAGTYDDLMQSREMRINAFRKLLIYYRNYPSVFIWDVGRYDAVQEFSNQLLDMVNHYDPYGGRLLGNKYRNISYFNHGERSGDPVSFFEQKSKRSSDNKKKFTVWNAPRRLLDTGKDQDALLTGFSFNGQNHYTVMSSEEMALRYVKNWKRKMDLKPYSFIGTNRCFFDNYSAGYNPSEVASVSGVVDAVRLPKAAYFALKTVWSEKPEVHILSHWNYADTVHKTINVISNCEDVKLWVNDRLYTCQDSLKQGGVFQFPHVKYEAGRICAKAYNQGQLCAEQQKETVGKPFRLKLTPIIGPQAWMANGADIALLDVEVVDKEGRRCVLSNQKVSFEVEGPAVWRGGYNSGKENSTNNLFLDVENGINRVALRSTFENGKVMVRAHSKGLKSARIVLHPQSIKTDKGLSTVFSQTY